MAVKFTEEDALKYRALINKVADALEDEEALSAPMLFDVWEADKDYEVGHKVRYNGVLYKVLIAHTSQSDWTPDVSPSLFAEVLIPDPEVIPDWVQPDSTNPYMKGDRVRYDGSIWESTIDYNVWKPSEYGWIEVNE